MDCAGRSVRRQCRSASHGDAELAWADSHALGRERRRRRLGSELDASALGVLPLVLLAMFCVVPRIDPKGEAYRTSGKFYQGFVIAFTLFMCAISWLGELTVWGVVPAVGSVNVLISGVVVVCMFIGVGNYLPRVKQNYTLGIKTPWALANPENWRRTQRFGGACFMVLGVGLIAMGVAGSVLSSEVVAAVIAVLAFGSVGAVYVYSYLLWRKSQRAVR